jgi:hypothetical protein
MDGTIGNFRQRNSAGMDTIGFLDCLVRLVRNRNRILHLQILRNVDGVGEFKLLYDGLTFAGSWAGCATEIIHQGCTHMRPGALPIPEQILGDILIPPALAVIWRITARGWAGVVQGVEVPEETRTRQKQEFWFLLIAAYVLMFGITIYAWIT